MLQDNLADHPMTDHTHNIEPLARALCARQLAPHASPAELPALVDRYWHVTAALIDASLIDDDGNEIPHSYEQGATVWRDWRTRHRA